MARSNSISDCSTGGNLTLIGLNTRVLRKHLAAFQEPQGTYKKPVSKDRLKM
jgi:hypothetical protein